MFVGRFRLINIQMAKRKESNFTQIKITRTEGEWELILNKICPNREEEMRFVSRYIRREVLKIKNQLAEIPEIHSGIGGKTTTKRPYIDNAILEDIKLIALKLKLEPQIFIDRLIITPLLQPQP